MFFSVRSSSYFFLLYLTIFVYSIQIHDHATEESFLLPIVLLLFDTNDHAAKKAYFHIILFWGKRRGSFFLFFFSFFSNFSPTDKETEVGIYT